MSDEASRQGKAPRSSRARSCAPWWPCRLGNLREATELGRRAARMAQAEALSHHEYLAHITLARIRRYSGRPHLALHILAALGARRAGHLGGVDRLGDIAGGGTPSETETIRGPVRRCRAPFAQSPGRGPAGDRSAFEKAAADTRKAAQIWPAFAAEVAALVAALDPLGQEIPAAMVPGPAARPPRFPSASTVSASNRMLAPKRNPPRRTSLPAPKKVAEGCCCPASAWRLAPECSRETPPEPGREPRRESLRSRSSARPAIAGMVFFAASRRSVRPLSTPRRAGHALPSDANAAGNRW